jgi:hypothetical protein
MDNLRVRIAVGITAAVWLVLALLADESISPTPLRIYSVAGAIVTIVFLLWEKQIWRWRRIRRFTGVPLVSGTWRGQIISSYEENGKSVGSVPAFLHISQTASSVVVTLFTQESSSTSERAALIAGEDGHWRLTWQYANTPRHSVRSRSTRHLGAAELKVGALQGEGLDGSYFTDRQTGGEMKFTEWSPRRYSSMSSGLSGKDFQPSLPFAREK